jgi:hypothetical protein
LEGVPFEKTDLYGQEPVKSVIPVNYGALLSGALKRVSGAAKKATAASAG